MKKFSVKWGTVCLILDMIIALKLLVLTVIGGFLWFWFKPISRSYLNHCEPLNSVNETAPTVVSSQRERRQARRSRKHLSARVVEDDFPDTEFEPRQEPTRRLRGCRHNR